MKTAISIFAALGLWAPLAAAIEPPADLTLEIGNLRSMRGTVMVCVTARADHFPDCVGDAEARRVVVAADAAAAIRVAGLPRGDYAVAVIHDENGNGRLDKRLIIPREGFGFSRNPAIRFGPPSFGDVVFALDGATQQRIRVRYLL